MKPSLYLVLALAVAGCTYHLTPVASILPSPADQPSDARVVLILPADFTEFTHHTSYEGREITYAFGRGATEPLKTIMEQAFRQVVVRPGEGGAMALFSAASGDSSAAFEFIALPMFFDPASSVTPGQYNISIGIRVDLVSTDRKRALSAQGIGRGTASLYLGSLLQSAGDRALSEAIASLRLQLASRRDSLRR